MLVEDTQKQGHIYPRSRFRFQCGDVSDSSTKSGDVSQREIGSSSGLDSLVIVSSSAANKILTNVQVSSSSLTDHASDTFRRSKHQQCIR